MGMTHRERILTACRRGRPDRMPWILGMVTPKAEEWKREKGEESYAAYYDFDVRSVHMAPAPNPADFSPYWEGRSFSGPAEFDREWGYASVAVEAGSHFRHWESPFAGRAFTMEDAEGYPMPDWDNDARYHDVQAKNDAWHEKGYATDCIIGFSTFDTSWLIRGYEDFLMDLSMEEPASLRLADRVSDAIAAQCKRMAERGTDIVGVGEDVGTQNALIMSPAVWRREIKPRFKKIVDAAKSGNPEVLFFYHSDGNILEIIPELIEIGVDILNPIQPECMDPGTVKEKFGDRLAFWGAVGTQTVMPHGTPADVRDCVHERFRTMGANGGYVCAPSHVLEPEVPMENIDAFVEAARECIYY
jgi:uroporphyrinogen decarboxylase